MAPNSQTRRILSINVLHLAMRFVMKKHMEGLPMCLLATENFVVFLQMAFGWGDKVHSSEGCKKIVEGGTPLFYLLMLLCCKPIRKGSLLGVYEWSLAPSIGYAVWLLLIWRNPNKNKNKNMEKSRKEGVSLLNRVAVSLACLGTKNCLTMCGDLYGMSEATANIVVCEFCDVVCDFVLPLVVPKFTLNNCHLNATKFEEKHGIPCIMGAIDCSHIPIIAPFHDPFSY